MMPKKIFSFRLDEDLIAEVDRLHPKRGERSDFVTAAISEKLQAGGAPSARVVSGPAAEKVDRSEKKFDGQAVKDGLRPDALVLLTSISRGRMTSRQAAAKMGWLGLRYSNAEKQLIQAGLAKIEDGVLVAEGE